MTEKPISWEIDLRFGSEQELSFIGSTIAETGSDQPLVTIAEDGQIGIAFGANVETPQAFVFRCGLPGFAFHGAVAGPIEQRNKGISRIWRAGEQGHVEGAPIELIVHPEEIVLINSFDQKATYFYFLLYELNGKTYICDPEITNDGDTGPEEPPSSGG